MVILLRNKRKYSPRRINILENTGECRRVQINQLLLAKVILRKAHVTYEHNEVTPSNSYCDESNARVNSNKQNDSDSLEQSWDSEFDDAF